MRNEIEEEIVKRQKETKSKNEKDEKYKEEKKEKWKRKIEHKERREDDRVRNVYMKKEQIKRKRE